jgi:hypothetical protein
VEAYTRRLSPNLEHARCWSIEIDQALTSGLIPQKSNRNRMRPRPDIDDVVVDNGNLKEWWLRRVEASK